MIVLGISLGSRTTGIAVIKDREILVSQTLTLRNKSSTSHIDTVDNYVRQYKILTVVIKTPPISHLSAQIRKYLISFLEMLKYHGCMVEYKDAKAIKKRFPEVRNKPDIIRLAVHHYPDLTQVGIRETANRQKYHVKMFDAVAIAHLVLNDGRAETGLSDK